MYIFLFRSIPVDSFGFHLSRGGYLFLNTFEVNGFILGGEAIFCVALFHLGTPQKTLNSFYCQFFSPKSHEKFFLVNSTS